MLSHQGPFKQEFILIVMQTLKKARTLEIACRARNTPQFVGHITDLIVPDITPNDGSPRAQAYLVEQTPNWTLPTHFHTQHQFQVFVAGGGSLGKHNIRHLEIHYASPYSAYGPLVSGDRGASYLTLRLMGDTGAWYLPESRPHLPLRIKKQQMHAAPEASTMAQPLASLTSPVEAALIAPEESGLAAWIFRLPPHHKMPAPASGENNGGRFYVVTEGALCVDGAELTGLATLFISCDKVLDLEAGTSGVEVIILQFPASALVDASTVAA